MLYCYKYEQIHQAAFAEEYNFNSMVSIFFLFWNQQYVQKAEIKGGKPKAEDLLFCTFCLEA